MSPTPNPPDNNSRILRQTEELSSSNHVVVHFEDVDDHQNINNNDGDDDLFDSSLDSSKSTSLIDIEEVVTMRGMKKQFKDMCKDGNMGR